jgi:hypothetical protein
VVPDDSLVTIQEPPATTMATTPPSPAHSVTLMEEKPQPQSSPPVDMATAVVGTITTVDGSVVKANVSEETGRKRSRQQNVLASNKGVMVQNVLMEMFQNGSFVSWNQAKCLLTDLKPPVVREMAKMRQVLELVELVMTSEEKKCLADHESNVQRVKTICQDLEEKAMEKMLVLERGETALLNSTSKVRPYFAGLGKRVADYKKQNNLARLG